MGILNSPRVVMKIPMFEPWGFLIWRKKSPHNPVNQ